MHYVISDSEGNTLDTFREERKAEQALLAMVADEPEGAKELLLLAHEDDGSPVGSARLYEDVLRSRTNDLAAAGVLQRSRDRLVHWKATTVSTQTVGSTVITEITRSDRPKGANATDDRVPA